MGEGQGALNRWAALGLALGLTLLGCTGGETAGSPSAGRSKPPAVSPSVSIYPVPSPGSPAGSPPLLTPDAAGIPCGLETRGTVQHISVTTRYACFEVGGSTLNALRADALREGPRVQGQRAVAATRWRIRWSYAFQDGGSCEVVRPDVHLIVVYELPAWTPETGAAEATRAGWRSFVSRVRQHETDHRRIAIEGTVAVREALLDLPAAASCDLASEAADARVKDVIAGYRTEQRRFDATAAG